MSLLVALQGAPAAITGSGVLASQAAEVDGVGVSASAGSGALSAQTSAVDGTGASSSIGFGALTAGDATVSGVGVSLTIGTGTLEASGAFISGVGDVLGDGPVSPPGGKSKRRIKVRHYSDQLDPPKPEVLEVVLAPEIPTPQIVDLTPPVGVPLTDALAADRKRKRRRMLAAAAVALRVLH